MIKTLKESLSGNHIHRITAILNGTCNYILSQMRTQKRPFADVLEEAQSLGYAEADPSMDIDGIDAAHKLALLSALAWGTLDFDTIAIDGIRTITAEDIALSTKMGYRLKHWGLPTPLTTQFTNRCRRPLCAPTMPSPTSRASLNAVTFLSDFCGPLTLVGLGAGGQATASAVVSDILDCAQAQPRVPVLSATPSVPPKVSAGDLTPYYVRLHVDDRPGVLAEIATTLAQQQISIETAWQSQQADSGLATLVIITHPSTPKAMKKAFATIGTLKPVRQAPCLLPIIN